MLAPFKTWQSYDKVSIPSGISCHLNAQTFEVKELGEATAETRADVKKKPRLKKEGQG